MIVITVELWPGGSEEGKSHLGTAIIANDGTGTATVGNYTVALSKKGHATDVWKWGRVEGFPRQKLGGWDLLCRALNAAIGERNR